MNLRNFCNLLRVNNEKKIMPKTEKIVSSSMILLFRNMVVNTQVSK